MEWPQRSVTPLTLPGRTTAGSGRGEEPDVDRRALCVPWMGIRLDVVRRGVAVDEQHLLTDADGDLRGADDAVGSDGDGRGRNDCRSQREIERLTRRQEICGDHTRGGGRIDSLLSREGNARTAAIGVTFEADALR